VNQAVSCGEQLPVNSVTSGPILIVDDDASSRTLVRELIEGAGYSTIESTTGEEALASADEQRPALVLLDVQLPGVSGYEVCRRLRGRFGERLPIIFVSGARVEAMDRVAGLLVGADDYIVKPFAPDELVARVWRSLARTAATSAAGGVELAARLTPREQEVLQLLAEGLTPKVIATELFISRKTVATHIQRILTKLDVHSRAEAIAIAHRASAVDDFEALVPQAIQ
jgi:DNA-binding NarL/FixJ family response regulator